MKLSDKIARCDESPIRKFHPYAVAAKKRGIKIHHLNIGQPDIQTPPAYFEALEAFRRPVLEYAPSPGIPELIEAVRGYYARVGVSYGADEILITTGGSEALLMAMLCILDEGDEVLVPEPFYPNYHTFITMAGGRLCPIATSPEENYQFASREKIEPLIHEKTRAILFATPGNPTGTTLRAEEIQLLADIAKERGLYMICDEVYREFVYDGSPLTSAGKLADMDENLILVDSVSKRFSACGARIGALITRNKQLMRGAIKIAQARLSVATLDQLGAAALYGVDAAYFDATREEYRRRRDTCYKKLMEIPGVFACAPQGAFYTMATLPVDDTEAFQLFLLNEFEDKGETVMFAPGSGFYATEGAGKSEIRIAYVLRCEDLERALDLLRMAIERYNAR
ncbi:MAG: pyridoxal phosphate-dependent aminotransferase [Oscillospiraceae bacterium]|jgi:aspartate aminotransferase|nr:pyridoxal phosphate-dependent aminotransferase [Oscillospiraceae bacterium]